ncbi:unnamed protein product [Dibothriocephalus latus]|uniref:DUF5641 domain-containing protein n=1 Tax=Dibothriocephalus latus TaxID=60516 RepID=A0A3P7Q8R8_DIBLA|nr:unnamed protein product [Dibothriocephalus latus]
MNGYIGISHTSAILRERYWIIRVLGAFIMCRRWHAPPCRLIMAPLRADRLEPYNPSFTFTESINSNHFKCRLPDGRKRGIAAFAHALESVRRILRSILGSQVVAEEVSTTTITETEKNYERRAFESGPCRFSLSWRQAQHLSDLLWKELIASYLPSLQVKQWWTSEAPQLAIGDLVLIWHHAAVDEEILRFNDGRVRDVALRTQQGTLMRDLRRLCLPENHEPRGE